MPRRARHRAPSLLGLAPGGVYRAVTVAGHAVRSYRTLSPLPVEPIQEPGWTGGLLSVALSLRSPSPGVTRHRVSMEPGLSSILHRWPTHTMTTETGPRSPGRLPPCQHRRAGKRRQVGHSALIAFELCQHQAIKIVLSASSDAGCNHTGNARR